MVQPQVNDPYKQLLKADLPVFFVQLGSRISLFFDRILEEAVRSNGHNNVFILTDVDLPQFAKFNCIDVSGFLKEAVGEFDQVYEHHSTNKFVFEKACFDRWFVIRHLVNTLGLDAFVHADSDVLIMQDLKPVHAEYIKDSYDGALMFFEKGDESVTSGHTSFWNRALINELCDFMTTKYTDKAAFKKMLDDTLSGKFLDNRNVSDMILLDVFRTEAKPNILPLLHLEDEGISIDFNANVSFNGRRHHFLMSKSTGIKKMTRKNDGLYGTVIGTVGHSKFYTLHFQGYLTKPLIPLHAHAANTAVAIRNILAARYHYTLRRSILLKNKLRDKIKRLF